MIRRDYNLHFWYGALISLFAIFILIVLGFETKFIGFALASLAGLLKEVVWDAMMKKGTPEWLDWLFTSLGGLFMDIGIHLILT